MLLWDYSPKIFGMRVALCRMMAKGSFFFNFVASLILVLTAFGHDFGDVVRYSGIIYFGKRISKNHFWGTTPGKLTLSSPGFPAKSRHRIFQFPGVENSSEKKNHPKPSGPKILASRSRSGFHSGDGIGMRGMGIPKYNAPAMLSPC